MIDWLLKEEEKNKVGRPKLADDKLMKRSRILFISSITVVIVLSFFLGCYLKGVSPSKQLYKITIGKIIGPIDNKNGFIINSYYNSDYDYVMNVKMSNKLKNYSASYKYTTYYLKGKKWIKYKSKTYDNSTNNIKILFESKKKENKTWKVKLQLVNPSKIVKDFAPYDWVMHNANTVENTYTYNIFTVKGYYSPVSLSEIKEVAKNKDDKVFVYTTKNNPRMLNISAPVDFRVKAKYTDSNNMENVLKAKESINQASFYKIPNINRVTKVTIYIWIDEYNENELKRVKLSNWKLKQDKNKNYYITNSYLVVPEKVYNN